MDYGGGGYMAGRVNFFQGWAGFSLPAGSYACGLAALRFVISTPLGSNGTEATSAGVLARSLSQLRAFLRARTPALPETTIARHAIRRGRDARNLTVPEVMTRVKDGKGEWLLTTIDFDAGWEEARSKTARLIQALFTNLGLAATENALEAIGDPRMLDLKPFANRGFQDDVAGDGRGGWTDGEFDRDLHLFPQNIPGLDQANLPMPAPPPSEWPSPLELGGARRRSCPAPRSAGSAPRYGSAPSGSTSPR